MRIQGTACESPRALLDFPPTASLDFQGYVYVYVYVYQRSSGRPSGIINHHDIITEGILISCLSASDLLSH